MVGDENNTALASTAQPPNGPPSGNSQASTESASDADPGITALLTSTELTAVEVAILELQRTMDEAKQYRQSGNLHTSLIRSHTIALEEDITLVGGFDMPSEELQALATRTVIAARRLKRHLDRDIIDIDIKQGAGLPSAPTASESVRATGLKLTPLKVPVFDGDTTQFRVFKSFFEENILYETKLSTTSKWLRLKESLSGRPAEIISEIPQTDHTLTVAWNLLNEIFGGDEKPIVEMYNKLQKLPVATMKTDSLRLTHSKIEGILLSLQQLGHNVDGNDYIRWIVLGKYPLDLLYQVQKRKDTPLADIRTAINDVISARESADFQCAPAAPQQPTESRKSFTPAPIAVNTVNDVTPAPAGRKLQLQPRRSSPLAFRPLRCIFCEEQHWSDECQKYVTLEERINRIPERCHRCLRLNHGTQTCTRDRKCYYCDSTEHNRALCPTKTAKKTQLAVVTQRGVDEPKVKSGYFITFVADATSDQIDTQIPVRVVVDTAGQSSVIKRETAKKLRLRFAESRHNRFQGLNGADLGESEITDAAVHLVTNEGEKITFTPSVVTTIAEDVAAPNTAEFLKRFPAYADVKIPPTGSGQPIDILLGSDVLVEILELEKSIKVDAENQLLATKFGWLLLTRNQQAEQVPQTILFHAHTNPIKQMSDLDVIGLTDIQQTTIDEENKAIRKFYDSVIYSDDRYSISWPWRQYPPQLSTNFGLAYGRLKSLWRKLKKSPKLLHEYHQIILKQLDSGIIEKVNPSQEAGPVVHYVPHHPVLQPGKSTSVRPVYDASSSLHNQKSLNDNIMKGSNWISDLVGALLRFRRHKTVAIADIEKAFHQIAINDADRDAVRFLWIKDPNQEPEKENLQIYRFTRVAFGVVASPFILYATIRHHANQQNGDKLIEQITKDLYADNLVTSLPNEIAPAEFYSHAKKFFGTMSMNLTKWATNDESLQKTIPEKDRLEGTIHSVLGLKWNRQTDALSLKQPTLQKSEQPSRRTVARDMAVYFDPLGWATPIVLLAKTFFRHIWETTQNWDAVLAEEEKEQWAEIKNKLSQITSISLPRRMYTRSDPKLLQLHAMVDASAQAYAIVIYSRAVYEEEVQVSLLTAKSRLTPKRQITIPKLELIAILLGARYINFVKEALQLDKAPETYVWSDSQCALSWMRTTKILPAILEKYIAEAKALNVNNYKYVPSESNYADVATRGADYETLLQMKWWSGPQWLTEESTWPNQLLCNSPVKETNMFIHKQLIPKKIIISEDDAIGIATINIKNFSTLTRLLRITATCLTALQRILKGNFIDDQPTVTLNIALKLWIRWDQRREYDITEEMPRTKAAILKGVPVFKDEDGIIRCQTRLTNADESQNTISPIILVKKSHLTTLIILHTHEQNMHTGTSHTLASLRKSYWLPQGRREIFNVLHSRCFRCKRFLAQPYQAPPPAPLPEFRIRRSQRPFQAIGVDTFGPIKVKIAETNQIQKRWVMIFTCAVIRAVHLEVLTDMTTPEFLFAFRRFIARRGVPEKIISDNAPQFCVLDRCFMNLWKTLASSPSISSYFAEKKIQWTFVVETAPWMGGLYERMIQTIKNAFEKTYASKILPERQFEVSIFEVEAIINSRPLAYIDDDPHTPIVTPNDFLNIKFTAVPIETAPLEKEEVHVTLWKSAQENLNQFWNNWANQYLLLLRERNDQLHTKKHFTKYQPASGDVVVMIDKSKRRSTWQIAVIERKIFSADGNVRAVQIRIPNGTRLIRPIVELAPLNVRTNLPNVRDDQLSRDRRNIELVAPEGAQFEQSQNSQEQFSVMDPEFGTNEQSDSDGENEAEEGGDGLVALTGRTGLENYLGAGAEEPNLPPSE